MSKRDQNVPKVLGVVCHRPRTKSGSHSLQGFFSDTSRIRSDAVRGWYSLDFRGGSGGGVWVGAVIGIEPSEQASREGGKGWYQINKKSLD